MSGNLLITYLVLGPRAMYFCVHCLIKPILIVLSDVGIYFTGDIKLKFKYIMELAQGHTEGSLCACFKGSINWKGWEGTAVSL